MLSILLRMWARIAPFGDISALVLITVGAVVLGLTDLPLLMMLSRWISFAFIVAGVVIVLSRISFPSVQFRTWIPLVKQGNVAAGIVLGAVILYCAVVFSSVVFWAK